MSRTKSPRPSKGRYKPEYPDQAFRLALLGLTQLELAKFFGVSDRAIKDWRAKYPQFNAAVLDGRAEADGKVAEAAYRCALGFEVQHEKMVDGEVVRWTERLPPNPTLIMFWLQNRRSEEWRDRRSHTVKGEIKHEHSGEVTVRQYSQDEIDRMSPAEVAKAYRDVIHGEAKVVQISDRRPKRAATGPG